MFRRTPARVPRPTLRSLDAAKLRAVSGGFTVRDDEYARSDSSYWGDLGSGGGNSGYSYDYYSYSCC